LGFKHRKEKQNWDGFDRAPDIKIIQENLSSAKYQLGTLGGGNHFIEIQKGDDGHIWIMLHSGSRNFGLKTANEYHRKAIKMCERWKSDIPNKDLAFLPMDTEEGREYMEAMQYCVDFALANRGLMMSRVIDSFHNVCNSLKFMGIEKSGIHFDDPINIAHNYASMEHHFGKNVLVHRKGATKATKGLAGIIPGSMGSKSYITEGKGNPESFNSCSHGAGRKMSRSQAKKTLNLEEEQKKMEGVLGKPRSQGDLDEAPGSYKDVEEVMENQKDLVEIKVELIPLASIKG